MPRSSFGFSLRLALTSLLSCGCLAVPLLGAEGPPVPAFRVAVEGNARDQVRAGRSELIWEGERKLARLTLTNLTAEPICFTVRTNPLLPVDESGAGSLSGLTRGFVGVIFLGASEITPDDSATATSHQLAPGETRMIEQPIHCPGPALEVVSTISLDSRANSGEAETAVEEEQLSQVRRNRDEYHVARQEEEARWKEVRNRLLALQAQCQPLTAEYKASLEQYWEALRLHQSRIRSLEARFLLPQPPASLSSPAQPLR